MRRTNSLYSIVNETELARVGGGRVVAPTRALSVGSETTGPQRFTTATTRCLQTCTVPSALNADEPTGNRAAVERIVEADDTRTQPTGHNAQPTSLLRRAQRRFGHNRLKLDFLPRGVYPGTGPSRTP